MTSALKRSGRTPRRSLGIQSKLLIALLIVSVLSVLVAGTIGYVSGTSSLRNAEFNRMTQLRESRAREITQYFETVANAASIVTHGQTTVNAARDFNGAFAELNAEAPTPAQRDAVSRYYETVFAPELSERTGEPADPTLFEPTGNAATYLQNAYTVPAGGGASRMLSEEAPGGVFGGTWQGVDWAPNGQTLVSDSSGDGIYTVNAATGATSGDLANNGMEPAFSPDGTKIVYVGIAESSGTKLDLWMMDANGANKQRVTQGGYDRAPNWAPR